MKIANNPTSPNVNEAVFFPFDECSMPFTRDLHMTLVTGRKMPDEIDWGANIVMDERQPNGPVMTEGKPGEVDSTEVICPNVFFVDGEYRMWYLGADDNRKRRTGLYAVSKDGFHWEKPKLGLVEYNGSKQNNLTEGPCGEWVFYDPEDPNPDRRFKSLRMGPQQGMRINAWYSRDGLRWKPGAQDIFDIGCELGHVFRFNGCFYANGQGGPSPINRPIPPPPGVTPKRIMVTFASYDFEHWTHAAAMSFRRDPLPPRLPTDYEPHRGEQIHEGAAIWDRGNVLIGFYGQYRSTKNDRAFYEADIGLLVSHDALHFTEPVPDFKMIHSYEERGGGGALLIQRNAFANIGDRTVYWYSQGRTGDPVWCNQQPTGVKVATWTRDRLGYFNPCRPNYGICGAYEPHCISCPIETIGAGAKVYINADGLGEHSQLKVELLDLHFRPLPGYSGDDCVVLSESGLRQPVRWQKHSALDNLDQPVRVRVNWQGIDERGEREKWYEAGFDDGAWEVISEIKDTGWGTAIGFGWYRNELPLPDQDGVKKSAYLYFGACDEDTWVYINGHKVFEHSCETTGLFPEEIWRRAFVVPLLDMKLQGDDLLAVRVYNSGGMGGIWKPVHLVISDQILTEQQIQVLMKRRQNGI